MHTLKNHLALRALHVQHTFVAQHARAINIDDCTEKIFQLGRVERPVGPEHKTLHVVIMCVMVSGSRAVLMRMVRMVAGLAGGVVMTLMVMRVRLFFQKIRINVKLAVQVESAQVEHFRERHLTEMHRFLRRTRVHVFQAVHQVSGFLRRHQIGLADEDLIRKTDLAARLLAVVKLLVGVFRVHQRQDRIEQITLGDLVVHEKRLRYRARVGHTGGFNHHAVKIQQPLALFGCQQLQRFAQVFPDGATNATIAHLNDLFLGIGHQDVVVDVFFAKFIFNDGNFLAVGLLQHTLEQRGFAGAKKAGEDGGWN